MPPQFVGRTVNETYLSPRGGSNTKAQTETLQQEVYQNLYDPLDQQRIE